MEQKFVCIDDELFIIDEHRSSQDALYCTSLEDFSKRIFYKAELHSRKVQYNEHNFFRLDL